MDVPIPPAAATPWEDVPEHAAQQTAPATDAAPAPARPHPGEIIEVHARPAALWQRITAFIVDGTLICGVLALYVGSRGSAHHPARSHRHPAHRHRRRDGPRAPAQRCAGPVRRPGAGAGPRLHRGASRCSGTAARRVAASSASGWWTGPGWRPRPDAPSPGPPWRCVSFVPFLAGFWLALFDRRGQTLHDKLTQTFVVRPG